MLTKVKETIIRLKDQDINKKEMKNFRSVHINNVVHS